MQYLYIPSDYTLADLADRVGSRNVDSILALNTLTRTYNIYDEIVDRDNTAYTEYADVDWQRKLTVLNSTVSDSDVFEKAALADDNEWRLISNINTFASYLAVPESIELPDAEDVLGDGTSIQSSIYNDVVSMITNEPHTVSPTVFNSYSSMQSVLTSGNASSSDDNVMSWFPIPWGDVTLYSSLNGDSIDFPVYPEELEDSTDITYDTMPDLLYQYEPWYVYSSTGPREISFTFNFHRDMWTGDHRDGKANELIRFCQSCQYAKYSGAAVMTDIVSLYIKGKNYITGVMSNFKVSWSGPLGLDGWYLVCELSFTIQEVSKYALSNSVVRSKELIS